jgi:hypothetical protein
MSENHDVSFKPESALYSPYSTVYQKPLRIMKVDSDGQENIEVTTTTYKTINEPVSIEKIKEICENIIVEKMFTKDEQSPFMQFMKTITDQFLQFQNKITSFMEESKSSNQADMDGFQKKIMEGLLQAQEQQFDRLEKQLLTAQKSDSIQNNAAETNAAETNETLLQNKSLMEIIREEVAKALDNIDEKDLVEAPEFQASEDLSEPSVKFVIQDFENIKEEYDPENVEDLQETEKTQELGVQLQTETLQEEKQEDVFEYIDENVLPDGTDMVFDDEILEDEKEQTSEFEYIDENLLPDGTDMIFDDNFSKEQEIVEDKVGDKVEDKVGEQFEDKVEDKVGEQFEDKVEDKAGDKVGEQFGDKVEDKVGEQVGDKVEDKVEDKVVEQVGDKDPVQEEPKHEEETIFAEPPKHGSDMIQKEEQLNEVESEVERVLTNLDPPVLEIVVPEEDDHRTSRRRSRQLGKEAEVQVNSRVQKQSKKQKNKPKKR